MTPPQSFLVDGLPGWVSALLALAVIAANVADRLRKGWPVFLPKAPRPDLQQTWVSAGASFPFVAHRCAWIRIGNGKLEVHLHFPWSVLLPRFLTELLGFEVQVPLPDVRGHEERYSSLLGEGLSIRFERNGRRQSVTVWTGKRDLLSRVLAESSQRRAGAV